MIFPDEKMIETASRDCAGLKLSRPKIGWVIQDVRDSFKEGAQWAITQIKSAASGNFEQHWQEERWDRYFDRHSPQYSQSEKAYQAAVISTAAKYEEKLERKVNALKNEERIRQDYVERTVKLQAENEQLKAELSAVYKMLLVNKRAEDSGSGGGYSEKFILERMPLATKTNKGK